MRAIYFFGLIFLFSVSFSQTESRYYNSWRFGLNIGGMWQTADVRSTAGVAGGFTLEKGIFENKTHFFSLAIRGRGLFGNTYGLDNSRNYNVKSNPALNGTYNKAVNYDSAGYIYNNYKTQISEGALELQISFNKLRERTNVLLNLWGGVGITSYRANTNLLDLDNKMYDYSKVDSSGSKSSALSSHKNLLDKSYESYANGSKKNNVYTFSPSAGIGIGYKVSDRFSILWEYKVTFPQGVYADYLDGIVGENKDYFAKSKDYYHYTGLNLLFRLGKGKTKSTPTKTTSVVTPITTNTTPVITNSVTSTPITTVNTTPISPISQLERKPVVTIVNPASSPFYQKGNSNYNVSANIQNVTQRNQINVTVNGNGYNNFSFNNNVVSVPLNLLIGNNNVTISATNGAGSDSKSTVINYAGDPPVINYTSPTNNPFSTTISELMVKATISNVVSNYDVVIKLNGNTLTNYSYSTANGLFSAQLPLINGNNVLEINATNPFGSDNKKLTIIYTKPANSPIVTSPVPVKVTITDPGTSVYKTNINSHNVKAVISGVSMADQISVTVNGVNTPFNFSNNIVDFIAMLNEGPNAVIVSAKNNLASDSKSATLIYEIIERTPPPTVSIVSPQPSPFTTPLTSYVFKAKTNFISNTSQIEVKFNGVVTNNYMFNPSNGEVELNTNLIANSNNIFEIKVTNKTGSNSANATVIQAIVKTYTETPLKQICHKISDGNFQTITIPVNEWAMHQAHGDYEGACKKVIGNPVDPEIIICHNTTGLSETITIKQSEWAAHQAHGDKMGPCPKPVNPKVTQDLDADLLICHNDGNGGKQSLTIKESQWPAHLAHGDTKGACPRTVPVEEKKITICHIPPGNNSNPQTIEINESAWPAHQAHGDYKGACVVTTPTVAPTNTVVTTPTVAPNNKITICHIPPGNNSNPQTIEISENAWPAHQAHGDYKGACVTSTTSAGTAPETGGLGGKKIKICHIPPGNNSNPQTIEINENAWPAHQAHGDTKGECSPGKMIAPKGGGGKDLTPSKGEGNIQSGKTITTDTIQKTEPIKMGRPR